MEIKVKLELELGKETKAVIGSIIGQAMSQMSLGAGTAVEDVEEQEEDAPAPKAPAKKKPAVKKPAKPVVEEEYEDEEEEQEESPKAKPSVKKPAVKKPAKPAVEEEYEDEEEEQEEAPKAKKKAPVQAKKKPAEEAPKAKPTAKKPASPRVVDPSEDDFSELDGDAQLEAIQKVVVRYTKKGKTSDIREIMGLYDVRKVSDLDEESYEDFYSLILRYAGGESVEDIIESLDEE